jgi:hypothetical protein
MEKLEKNAATEALENYYQCSLQAFVSYVCRPFDGAKPSKRLPEDGVAGMFVHRHVYSHLAGGMADEFGQPPTAWAQDYLKAGLLVSLGFKAGPEDKKRERYTTPYRHPKLAELVLWSDNDYVEVEYKGKKQTDSFYHPKDLFAFLEQKKLTVPKELLALQSKNHLASCYDLERQEYDAQQAKIKAHPALRELLQLAAIGRGGRFTAFSIHGPEAMFTAAGKVTPVPRLYPASLYKQKPFRDLVVGYRNFEYGLANVNTLLLPSYNGLQCGNAYASQALSSTIASLAQEQVRQQMKAEQEDSD